MEKKKDSTKWKIGKISSKQQIQKADERKKDLAVINGLWDTKKV